jgi:hypothetical protein
VPSTAAVITSQRASANRTAKLSAQRTAASNTQYRHDIQRVRDRQQQRTIVGEWKRYIVTKMYKDRTGSYRPFVLNNLIEQHTATSTDTTALRRRILTNVCETATLALNTSFSKSHPTRHLIKIGDEQ